MRDFVAKVLGHDELCATALRRISAPGSQRLILQGKSGTGKSMLVEAIAKKSEAVGIYVVVLRGDRGRPDFRYHPLDGLRFRTKTANLFTGGLDVFWEAVGELRPGAKTLGKAMKVALTASREYFGEPKSTVGDHVCEAFITGMQRIARRKDILLVLDDIQYFDSASLTLLERLIREFMHEVSLSTRLNMIATHNVDQALTERALSVLKTFSPPTKVETCARENFPRLMHAFGLHKMPDAATLDLLFDCSGCNLEVVRALAAELAESQQIRQVSREDLFREMLSRTLERTLRPDDPLLSILSIASVAGTGINRAEVACLTGHSTEELAAVFKRARDLSLVEETGSFYRFRHDVTWRFFCQRAAKQEREIHARYAKCLKFLRPSNYDEQQRHLLVADQREQAAIAGALALLQADRRQPLSLDATDHLDAWWWREFMVVQSITIDLLEAMKRIREGRIDDALTILNATSEMAPDALLAERDFLRATAYLKRPSRASIERAAEILTEWSDTLAEENVEIWSRLKSTLVFALVQAGRFEIANNTRQAIFRKLARYANLDENIKRALLRWELNANMLLEPEAANRQIDRATKALLQLSEVGASVSPSDAFTALTNLSSSELSLSRFDRASALAIQALKLQKSSLLDLGVSALPVLSNLLVSECLVGRMSSKSCADRLMPVVDRARDNEDFALLSSNCLAAFIEAGDLAGADRLIRRLSEIVNIDELEDYTRYFWIYNIAILTFLRGRTSEAGEIISEITTCLDTFPPGDRRTMTVRHKRILDALTSGVASLGDLDDALRSVPPGGGPTWPFFARSALYTPIEIWADI